MRRSKKRDYQDSRRLVRKKGRYQSALPPQQKRGWLGRFLLGLFLLAGFLLVVVIFINPLVMSLDLRQELVNNRQSSIIYDREGLPLANLHLPKRLYVPLSQIPVGLQQAFIVTEDARFYQHKGIDPRGILRALYEDLKAWRKVQGGSTITQQLVKNLFFSQQKSAIRKILEMAYALRIEAQYSKADILEMYLNNIYLGHGAWGIEAAALTYFGKHVTDLDQGESALLASLAKSPEYYSPFRNPEAARRRRNLVLSLLHKYNYLTREAMQRLQAETITTLAKPTNPYPGAYFNAWVIKYLAAETGWSEAYLKSGGLQIHTTLDRQRQNEAEAILRQLPSGGPDRWGVEQPQGALVALNPQNGQILALVGGRSYSSAQVNRATAIHRQPGSAIKPFLYTAALEAGFEPETEFVDQPLTISVNGLPWQPQNYDNQYRGVITLQQALEESVNTIAVQLVQEVGVRRVFDLTRKMGLTSLVEKGFLNDLGPAPLALGGLTKGVTLLELTGAYTPFANRGLYSQPFGVTRVLDSQGRVLYRRARSRRKQVIEPQTARLMTRMMTGVITKGTGIRANIGIPAAGKTGTTNQNTNGWFIGYTRDLLVGIWLGNDQVNQPLIVEGRPLGSGKAAELWGNFVKESHGEMVWSPSKK